MPAYRKRAALPLARILESDAMLGQWLARQREEARLTTEVRRQLPRALGLRMHVAGLRDGVLEISAGSGAVAAALRQRAPSLPPALRAEGFAVSEVKIRVRPMSAPADAARSDPRSVDPRAAKPLFDLADRLPKGPLRDALTRWSRRARGR